MNLLRNVAHDGDGSDQALMHSGANERNIEQCLAVIEDRIDYAIQMSRAAAKIHLNTGDFKTRSIPARKYGKGLVPNLPTLQDPIIDEDDVDGDDTSKLRPVNIDALKDFMIKKVNKIAAGVAAEAAQPKDTLKAHRHRDPASARKSKDTSLDLSSASILSGGGISSVSKVGRKGSVQTGAMGGKGRKMQVKKQ